MERLATLFVGLVVLTSAVALPAAATTQSTDCSFPVTMTDATGTEVTLEERPERVTTTNPSAAQTMWEIGGREQVVGLTQYASYLEGADSRRNVSAAFGVNVERVVATNPDLVIAPNASAGQVQKLRDAGLTVYHLPEATGVEAIRAKTTTIGRLTGNCQGAAETNAWMTANVEAIRAQTAGVEDRPRALYPLGGGYVAPNGTFISAVMELSGARNVVAAQASYPQLNDEVVLERDPEVLFVTEGTKGLVATEPYASTTAGENNRTVVLRTRDLNQPAPRSVVNAVHNATAQLHPDRYDPDSYVSRSAVVETPTPTTTAPASTPMESATPTTTGGSGPGFVALSAALAVVVTALGGELLRN